MEEDDPRVARSRRRIRSAALAELAEAGWGGMRMDAVATRAGVGRSTLYRHWPDKLALVVDALEVLNVQPTPDLREGRTRDDVRRLLAHLADALADPTFSRCLPALVDAAARDPRAGQLLAAYSDRRRATLTGVLARGVRQGDLRGDIDPETAAAALAGPLFYTLLLCGRDPRTVDIDVLITTVLGPA